MMQQKKVWIGERAHQKRLAPFQWRRIFRWPLLTLATAFFVALPILAVLGSLLQKPSPEWQHLAATVLPDYIVNSFLLTIGVGMGTIFIGVATAWVTSLCSFPGRGFLGWALLLPMAFPAYVVAYAYTGMLDYAGPIQRFLRSALGDYGQWSQWLDLRSLPGAILILVLVLYPYVYLLARAAFLEQSVCVLEVSRTLGCSPTETFWRVGLPLARPAIVVGAALAIMEALNDFGTVQYFGIDTLVTGIFRLWRGMGDEIAARQLASLLLCVVLALLVIERLQRGARAFHHTTGRYRPLPRFKLSGVKAVAAILGCALPTILGFFVPFIMLAFWAWQNPEYWQQARFFGWVGNSFMAAGLASFLTGAIALALAYKNRSHRHWLAKFGLRVATLGYGIPGAVLAIGVLAPVSAIDHWIARGAQFLFEWKIGLLFTGTLGALLFAYIVRFLTVSFNSLDASLGKITQRMEDAARSLGRNPFQTLREIHFPLMRGSFVVASILVFVEVLKELPATLALRPFNFDTLATRAYDLAADERLQEAAGPALAIGLIGILPVLLLVPSIGRYRPGERDRVP